MSMVTNTLGRYFAGRFVISALGVFLSIFVLLVLVDYIEMVRKTSGLVGASPIMVAETSLFRVPQLLEKMMPFCVLIGAMTCYLALSRRLDPVLRAAYDAVPRPNAFSPDARAAGGRALRNALLDLIMAGYAGSPDRPERLALAEAHFAQADNMTDMIGGLGALAYAEPEAFERALTAFYDRFRTEPLVIDKWFALQSGSANADPARTRQRVRALIQHPDFDPKTPNRWRAVVQAFAGNPAAFHAEDGSGYDVLVEQVLMVDAFNPMTAARLVEPLSRFRIYESPWREAMQAALTRIRDAPGLSKNVLELSAKALDG